MNSSRAVLPAASAASEWLGSEGESGVAKGAAASGQGRAPVPQALPSTSVSVGPSGGLSAAGASLGGLSGGVPSSPTGFRWGDGQGGGANGGGILPGEDDASEGAPRGLVGALLAKTGPYRVSRHWGRKGRRVLAGRNSAACYHVMSRTCGGGVFFDDEEKEGLRVLLWKMCRFLGIELLTYCIMGNHFHALVRVPDRATWLRQFDGEGGEDRLLAHLSTFYSHEFMGALQGELEALRAAGLEGAVREKLEAFRRRFCDLGIWMKEMKERYSRWYNRKHERSGTLWMGRFRSVLVEGRGNDHDRLDALRTMALYIDLNPVRAGLVDEPEKYRWSGYGEAFAGAARARSGLCQVVGARGWARCGPVYRVWLYSVGRAEMDVDGSTAKLGINPEQVAQVMREFGQIRAEEKLRSRVGSFTDGAVIGSKEFVEEVFAGMKDDYRRTRRGANPLPTRDGLLHMLSGVRQSE